MFCLFFVKLGRFVRLRLSFLFGACSLLVVMDLPVTAIAFDCLGYLSPNSRIMSQFSIIFIALPHHQSSMLSLVACLVSHFNDVNF